MPSIVVISSIECMMAKERQEFTRRPLTCTVQAPHWPWSQPFFVPGMFRFSRRQSSNVVRGSSFRLYSLPLMRRETGTAPSTPSVFGTSLAAGGADGETEGKTGGVAASSAKQVVQG